MTRRGPRPDHIPVGDHVTDRQLEVLAAIVARGTHQEAATALGISRQTVKFHLTRLYRALGVENEIEAIREVYLRHRDGMPTLACRICPVVERMRELVGA